MSVDERLRTAAADIAAAHDRRPIPALEPRSPFPRWAAAAALATVATAAFVFIGTQGDAPVEPVTSTAVTTPTTVATPTTAITPTTESAPSPTSTAPSTTIPSDPIIAWTEMDAERMVEGFLAALAAGQWEIAAFSMDSNGIWPDGARADELPAGFLERSCGSDLCLGPYDVTADGRGLVDPVTSQAASTVTVTHIASGETATIHIATFEGQPIIADLPPLVPGESQPLARALFDDDLPNDLVLGRFDAVERWRGDSVTWNTQWLVESFVELDGDLALAYEAGPDRFSLTPIDTPERGDAGSCPALLGRGVVPFEGCPSEVFGPTGERLGASDFPTFAGNDPGFSFYAERAGVRVTGTGDAEGNLVELTRGPVDLLGDDYASIPRLSPDGRNIAYVDHADDRAESHFWSPVVVVKDTSTGAELQRIAFDDPVLWLEFDGRWIVVGGRNADYAGGDPRQETIETFNIETGRRVAVNSPVRVWLP